jgi:hypothetical protein
MAKPTRPKARPTAAPTKSKRPPSKMPMFDAPSPREEEPMKKAVGGPLRAFQAMAKRRAAEGKNLFGGRRVDPEDMGRKAGGKVMKKAKGGMCRGMGAAKKGGSYKAM